MSRKIKHDLTKPYLQELDRLVLAEIDAMQSASQKKPPVRESAEEKPVTSVDPGRKVAWLTSFHPSPEGKRPGKQELEADQPPLSPEQDEAAFEAGYQAEKHSELDPDEERFVAQVAAFLGPRLNKDVIMARIWSLVTESEPEAFFSPEPESGQAQGQEESLTESSTGPSQ